MSDFKSLGLSSEIMQAIAKLGFEEPTPVQAKAIPQLLNSRRDLIAYAQTGTGKTAAFSLPIIEQIDQDSKHIQALILNPTRELCLQTSNEIRKFLEFLPNINIVSVYGGDSKEKQARQLRKGVHIVIGTPGRVHDFIRGKQLKLQHLRVAVLDEADEMLTMGFEEDLNAILDATPDERQTLLFSATMPKNIKDLVQKYMDNPVEVNAGTQNISAENIEHTYSVVRARDKYAALKRFADYYPDIYGIVFCRTRMDTKNIADKLMQDGYSADALHGDLSQAQREQVMKRFRAKQIQILVATDVAARGLDINNLTHVIHYHLPDQAEAYIHRSGRTGRAGNSGVSLALINSREKNKVRTIEKMIKQKMTAKEVPGAQAVCEQQLLHLLDRIDEVEVDEKQIAPYYAAIQSRMSDWSKEDILKSIVSLEFNRFLSYYKDAPDLNYQSSRGDDRKERDSAGRNKELDRYYINIGTRDGLDPGLLIKILNQQLSNYKFKIGQIDLMRNFSFFEVEKGLKNAIQKSFRGFTFKGRDVRIEFSSDQARSHKSRKQEKKRKKKKAKKKFRS